MSQLGRIPQGKNEVFHTISVNQMNVVGTGGISSIGQIDIDSRQAAADAVRINASNAAGGIDVDAGTGGINVLTTGQLDMRSSSAVADAVTLAASNAAGGVEINAGTNGIQITGTAGPIQLTSSEATADAIVIDAANAAGGVIINSGTGGVTIITTGQTQLDGTTYQGGAIAGVTGLATAQSGTAFTVSDASGVYAITLPPTAAGLNYKFALIVAGSNNVTLTATGAHFFGVLLNGAAAAQINAQTNIVFTSANGAIGDIIHVQAIDATHWYVSAGCSTTAGITTS